MLLDPSCHHHKYAPKARLTAAALSALLLVSLTTACTTTSSGDQLKGDGLVPFGKAGITDKGRHTQEICRPHRNQ